MWVLHQDEYVAIECCFLTLNPSNKKEVMGGCIDRSCSIVGRYESKERAKEVVRDFMLSIQQGKQTFWMPEE